MITIDLSANKKNLEATISGSSYNSFNKIINIFRKARARYNNASKKWILSPVKYENIRDQLEELDEVVNNVSVDDLIEVNAGNQTLRKEKQRRIPDYSLLNYEPITGKHPHENFQKEAIAMGINANRRAEFLGMGSGKSYIAAAIIAHRLYKYHDCSKVLFITSSIGVKNLYYELFKFIKDLPEDKVVIADKNYRNPFDDSTADIVICSYNTFRLICNYYKKEKKITATAPRKPFLPLDKWSNKEPRMLILDESHNAANSKSQQGHFIALHADEFEYRYLFSGTPADKIEKIYNQYRILDNYLVYGLSYSEWKEKMAVLGDHFSATAIREWKKDELEKQNKRFTSQYGEYYKTTELVDLPDYNEKRIYLKMSPEHRSIYENFVKQDLAAQTSTRDIVNRFPYMCLAVDNPHLLEKHEEKFDDTLNKMIISFKDKNLAKLDAIEDIISDHPGERL